MEVWSERFMMFTSSTERAQNSHNVFLIDPLICIFLCAHRNFTFPIIVIKMLVLKESRKKVSNTIYVLFSNARKKTRSQVVDYIGDRLLHDISFAL